jgi:hypothetical protein
VGKAGVLVLPKPTTFCQKQKLCCRAFSACFEACASTISTRLAPGRRTLILPLIDVFVQKIAGNLGCAQRTKKWLEMETPSTFGIGLGTLSIDLVVS